MRSQAHLPLRRASPHNGGVPRYGLLVAYDGTAFHGWQRQEPPGAEPLRTVQGVLQEAVRTVVGEPVTLLGASRTDAGVHARGQVAAFTTSRVIPVERLSLAITSRCPPDVQVRGAMVVPEAFDPISDARAKGYRYSLQHGRPSEVPPPLFDRTLVYSTWHRLDPSRMKAAADRLVGRHDFASFTRADHGRESTVRTIHTCTVHATGPHRIEIDVSGDGFLYNMVRIIAGTLVEAGRGRMTPEQVAALLAAPARERAGPTLPPEGLCLSWIHDGPGFGPLAGVHAP